MYVGIGKQSVEFTTYPTAARDALRFAMMSIPTTLTLLLTALSVVAAPVAEPESAAVVSALEARQSCADVVVFFARGTTESGTKGTVVGPPFESALNVALGSKSPRFEGVPYPAVISGYLAGGDRGGAKTMAGSVTSTTGACPNSKVVISGYSQGAQVTHLAAAQLSSAVQNRVVAVVTFGDPYRSQSLPGVLQNRRLTFCNSGDLICNGQPIVLPPHFTYDSDAPEAARFVAART